MRQQRVSNYLGYVILILAMLFGCVCESTEQPAGADLIIASFTVSEDEWLSSGGFNAMAEVTVKNIGSEPASSFDVAIAALNSEDNLVRFEFSYDSTATSGLDSGQSVTLSGHTGLGWHGYFDVACIEEMYDADMCAMRDEQSLELYAIADYCESFNVSNQCAILELDEANNMSMAQIITKP